MAKKWKNKKVKHLAFQKDLQILLAEYDYFMDCRLIVNQSGITPKIVVDEIPKQPPKQPQVKQVDVKEKAKEQKPRPKGKGN